MLVRLATIDVAEGSTLLQSDNSRLGKTAKGRG